MKPSTASTTAATTSLRRLAVLMHTASTEARSVSLLQLTEAHTGAPGSPSQGAASVCLALLDSSAARADADGVSFAANALRNLAMPPANRDAIGALPAGGVAGPLGCLERRFEHTDPTAATMLAATARLLVEGCPRNAGRFLEATREGAVFGPLVALLERGEAARVHPHARVEMARFVSLVLAAAQGAPAEVRAALLNGRVLGLAAFLLASSHRALHLEGGSRAIRTMPRPPRTRAAPAAAECVTRLLPPIICSAGGLARRQDARHRHDGVARRGAGGAARGRGGAARSAPPDARAKWRPHGGRLRHASHYHVVTRDSRIPGHLHSVTVRGP